MIEQRKPIPEQPKPVPKAAEQAGARQAERALAAREAVPKKTEAKASTGLAGLKESNVAKGAADAVGARQRETQAKRVESSLASKRLETSSVAPREGLKSSSKPEASVAKETAVRKQAESKVAGENGAAQKKLEGAGNSPVKGLKESSAQSRVKEKEAAVPRQSEKTNAASEAASGAKNSESAKAKELASRQTEKPKSSTEGSSQTEAPGQQRQERNNSRVSDASQGKQAKAEEGARSAREPEQRKASVEGNAHKEGLSSKTSQEQKAAPSESPKEKQDKSEGTTRASERLEPSKVSAERIEDQVKAEKAGQGDATRPQQVHKAEGTATQRTESTRPTETTKPTEVVSEQKNDSQVLTQAAFEEKSHQKASVQEHSDKKIASEGHKRSDAPAASQDARNDIKAPGKHNEVAAEKAHQQSEDATSADKMESDASAHQVALVDHKPQKPDDHEPSAQSKEHAPGEPTNSTQEKEEAAREQLESTLREADDMLAQTREEQRLDSDKEQADVERNRQRQTADMAQRAELGNEAAERVDDTTSLLVGQDSSSDHLGGIHTRDNPSQESPKQPLQRFDTPLPKESKLPHEQISPLANLAGQSDGVASKVAGAEAARHLKLVSLKDLPVTKVVDTSNSERALDLEESISDRQAKALDYYSTAHVHDIRQELDGIDFTAEVIEVTYPAGSVFIQYQRPDNPIGNYFALVGTPAEALGISALGRELRIYVAVQEVAMLQSRARGTDRDPRMPPAFKGKGGGTQFFVRDKSPFLLLREQL